MPDKKKAEDNAPGGDQSQSVAEVAARNSDNDQLAEQSQLVREAIGATDDGTKVRSGERAVRLAYDIEGGLGNHKKGTVIRNLSESAFITLANGGGHDVVEPGSDAGADAIDASMPVA